MILGHALPLGKTFLSVLAVVTPVPHTLFLARFVLACVLPKRRLTATLIGPDSRQKLFQCPHDDLSCPRLV